MCRYEGELRAKGTPQDKIRPPRFKQEGSPDYPGGSKDAECCLCPVKRGIFKQAVGSERWVHLVCAHWQTPEVSVANEDVADAVRSPGAHACAGASVRPQARSSADACVASYTGPALRGRCFGSLLGCLRHTAPRLGWLCVLRAVARVPRRSGCVQGYIGRRRTAPQWAAQL